ncbi:MAG: DUF3793 family protein [Clostridia bacterium]|nr:DUF3793 family protein [Clostridia bacterium]
MSNEILIRCCAPTMASLKTGNMFNCAFESREQMTAELKQLNRRLGRKGLRILPLKWRNGKALLYLYRPKLLERDLRDPLARALLAECGYASENISACLTRLMTRVRTGEDFPHEVGLFLGYPPADVDGFMHRKEECKLCGLWKVYDDVESAHRQFARCRHCTEVYLTCLSRGFTLDRLAVAR